jgi:AcrR family transcriptional regulator
MSIPIEANRSDTVPTQRKARGKGGTADSNATIERILDAAEEEFALKGASGARVEQIAQRADVAKALIYYYFKGKDELLQALIERTLRGSVAYKLTALEAPKEGQDIIDTLLLAGSSYIKDKLNVLRIMMLELLKKDTGGDGILGIIDELFASSKMLSKDTPLFSKMDDEEARTELFFFGSMPFCLFLLLEDKWVEHFKVDRGVLEDQFFRSAVKILHFLSESGSGKGS